MDILDTVKAHERESLSKGVRCRIAACRWCQGVPGEFKLHERRRRKFLAVLARVVEEIVTFLLRWKCPLCNRTFTEYPCFAFPYKRYVRQEVCGRGGRYVQEDEMTYQQAAQEKQMPVAYAGERGEEKGSQLSRTTVWRWGGFLGGLKEMIRLATGIIRRKSITSDVSRRAYAVSSRKYRSDQRRKVLEQCKRLCDVEGIHRRLLGLSIFPRYGTAASFT